ncbi:hypothetical protein DU505_20175 [Billgrantia montanilacus]|uniref:Uncharacterized protein n=1 Tax=Billgrantia montanilacus TaxID=2282305 RepID=A0A368TQD8_9GAMM|nr:hypothetical protein DU505_20175 [Halomonas montanilacus]
MRTSFLSRGTPHGEEQEQASKADSLRTQAPCPRPTAVQPPPPGARPPDRPGDPRRTGDLADPRGAPGTRASRPERDRQRRAGGGAGLRPWLPRLSPAARQRQAGAGQYRTTTGLARGEHQHVTGKAIRR